MSLDCGLLGSVKPGDCHLCVTSRLKLSARWLNQWNTAADEGVAVLEQTMLCACMTICAVSRYSSYHPLWPSGLSLTSVQTAGAHWLACTVHPHSIYRPLWPHLLLDLPPPPPCEPIYYSIYPPPPLLWPHLLLDLPPLVTPFTTRSTAPCDPVYFSIYRPLWPHLLLDLPPLVTPFTSRSTAPCDPIYYSIYRPLWPHLLLDLQPLVTPFTTRSTAPCDPIYYSIYRPMWPHLLLDLPPLVNFLAFPSLLPKLRALAHWLAHAVYPFGNMACCTWNRDRFETDALSRFNRT